jgi:hypothetical protein
MSMLSLVTERRFVFFVANCLISEARRSPRRDGFHAFLMRVAPLFERRPRIALRRPFRLRLRERNEAARVVYAAPRGTVA